MRAWFAIAIAAVCTGSCSDVGDADPRGVWLQETLLEDNAALIERDPELAADKFEKMADDIYLFFRGTAPQFARDASEPGPGYMPTEFGSFESSRVLVVGDPHYENIGSYLSWRTFDEYATGSGELILDFNDFDAAGYGPYWLDVRRLALSFYVAGRSAQRADAPLSDETIAQAVNAVSRSYAEHMLALDDGEAPLRVRRNAGFGTIVDDLFRRAQRDGDVREELDEYTVELPDPPGREMFFGTVEEPAENYFGDEVEPVSNLTRARVEELVALYLTTIADESAAFGLDASAFEVLGVSRRLGAGVGSYPVERYYVVVPGPSDDPDDDWLLEIKEIRDPVYPRWQSYPRRTFEDNAQRGVEVARRMQETSVNDPLLGYARTIGVSYRVRHRSKYQKNLAVDRLAEKLIEGDFSEQDFVDVAEVAGALLARSHGQSPTLDGRLGVDVIAPLLRDRLEEFVEETSVFAERYGAQFEEDYEIFRALMDEHGPLLGYRFTPSLR